MKSSPTSVNAWIKEFLDICTFQKIRKGIVKNSGHMDDQIITKDFLHSDITYTLRTQGFTTAGQISE